MSKIMDFIKNKSIGYFIVAGTALLSLILAIIFFATYSNPDVATQMGAKATGYTPETIGVFLLAGFVVEVIMLVVPQYKFVQLAAIAMFGLALYKEVIIIPDFIVGKINNVEYNGGNFGLNMFFFITLLIIVIASIVPAFTGLYTKEEDSDADMPIKGTTKIVKVAGSAVLVVAAVLAGSLVSNSLTTKSSRSKANNQTSDSSEEKKVKKDPITDAIREAAALVEYDYNPEDVLVKEKELYCYSQADADNKNGYYNSDLSGLSHSQTRANHHLIYIFEGVFSEGYQGGYDTYEASLYLWDDGLFTGKSRNDNFKGYWYNSSIDDGHDEEGNDVVDCLNMVSNSNNYTSIITDPVKGFYERQGYVHINPGWGDRSVVVTGYKYYPDVAMFIDTDDIVTFKVGEVFDRQNDWAANRVIKKLSYTPIVNVNEVTWTYPDGMLDENNKFVAAGEYVIKAKWKTFEDSVTITVTE